MRRLSRKLRRYKHFGRDIIRVVTGGELSDETVDVLYERVYTNFIEHIDGIDNGIEAYEGAKRYKVSSRHDGANAPDVSINS